MTLTYPLYIYNKEHTNDIFCLIVIDASCIGLGPLLLSADSTGRIIAWGFDGGKGFVKKGELSYTVSHEPVIRCMTTATVNGAEGPEQRYIHTL